MNQTTDLREVYLVINLVKSSPGTSLIVIFLSNKRNFSQHNKFPDRKSAKQKASSAGKIPNRNCVEIYFHGNGRALSKFDIL